MFILLSRRLFRYRCKSLSLYRSSSTAFESPQRNVQTAKSNIDFLAIEKRWQAKWDAQGTKIQQEGDDPRHNSIAPFYMAHISQPTMMGKLQSTLEMRGTIGTEDGKTSMLEHILAHYGDMASQSSCNMIDVHSQKYGNDIVRTCLLLGEGIDEDTDSSVQEASLERTKEWFERIWNAIRVTHTSYIDTQSNRPDKPIDLEARNDPDVIDDMIDYNLDLVGSFVYIPPSCSKKIGIRSDENTCALWLAAQEAIVSMTRRSESVDPHEVRSRLSSLTSSIISYDDAHHMDLNAHYHATRILLSLLAITAPSFAEAGWLALHYGHSQWRDGEEREKDKEEEPYDDCFVLQDLIKFGYHNLPRRNDPRTLSSIFAQQFPVPVPSDVMELLRRKSANSTLEDIDER